MINRVQQADLTSADIAGGTEGFEAELCFASYLTSKSLDSKLAKGERTRLLLKASAARLLAQSGYHNLQMREVSRDAGFSAGTAYTYFDNKEGLTLELMTEFLNRWVNVLGNVTHEGDVYQWLYSTLHIYVRIFSQNAGLAKCFHFLLDDLPPMRELQIAVNNTWYEAFARGLRRGYEGQSVTLQQCQSMARMLTSFVASYLHEVYSHAERSLVGLAVTPDLLTEMLAIMAYRMAYGANPSRSCVAEDHPLLRMTSPIDPE